MAKEYKFNYKFARTQSEKTIVSNRKEYFILKKIWDLQKSSEKVISLADRTEMRTASSSYVKKGFIDKLGIFSIQTKELVLALSKTKINPRLLNYLKEDIDFCLRELKKRFKEPSYYDKEYEDAVKSLMSVARNLEIGMEKYESEENQTKTPASVSEKFSNSEETMSINEKKHFFLRKIWDIQKSAKKFAFLANEISIESPHSDSLEQSFERKVRIFNTDVKEFTLELSKGEMNPELLNYLKEDIDFCLRKLKKWSKESGRGEIYEEAIKSIMPVARNLETAIKKHESEKNQIKDSFNINEEFLKSEETIISNQEEYFFLKKFWDLQEMPKEQSFTEVIAIFNAQLEEFVLEFSKGRINRRLFNYLKEDIDSCLRGKKMWEDDIESIMSVAQNLEIPMKKHESEENQIKILASVSKEFLSFNGIHAVFKGGYFGENFTLAETIFDYLDLTQKAKERFYLEPASADNLPKPDNTPRDEPVKNNQGLSKYS